MLVSEVAANITHQACHNIDTAKELQKSGQGNREETGRRLALRLSYEEI